MKGRDVRGDFPAPGMVNLIYNNYLIQLYSIFINILIYRAVNLATGFDALEGAPNTCENDLRSSSTVIKDKAVHNDNRKSSSLNMTVKKLADELRAAVEPRSDHIVELTKDDGVPRTSVNDKHDGRLCNSDEADNFEFEECDTILPPVYLLRDEGTDKWCMLTDLQSILNFKSKETLLKQICPPHCRKEELIREFKMNDFLQKATCLHLLCSGEKLNIRASKVSLIKYTDSVRNLLGAQTVVLRL